VRWVKPTTSNGMPLYGVRVNIASHDHPNTMCQFFGPSLKAPTAVPELVGKSNPGSPYVSFLYVRTQTWKVLSTFPWTATCDLHTLLHYAILHGSVYPLSQNHPALGLSFQRRKSANRQLVEHIVELILSPWLWNCDCFLVIRHINTAMGVSENGPRVPKPWVSILK
jgi:hypothetical protein